eukprot:Hpha_TRINITY_DN16103_c4_g1::TRINITY_DN16103_c4_g1_i1::g.7612::m.7612
MTHPPAGLGGASARGSGRSSQPLPVQSEAVKEGTSRSRSSARREDGEMRDKTFSISAQSWAPCSSLSPSSASLSGTFGASFFAPRCVPSCNVSSSSTVPLHPPSRWSQHIRTSSATTWHGTAAGFRRCLRSIPGIAGGGAFSTFPTAQSALATASGRSTPAPGTPDNVAAKLARGSGGRPCFAASLGGSGTAIGVREPESRIHEATSPTDTGGTVSLEKSRVPLPSAVHNCESRAWRYTGTRASLSSFGVTAVNGRRASLRSRYKAAVLNRSPCLVSITSLCRAPFPARRHKYVCQSMSWVVPWRAGNWSSPEVSASSAQSRDADRSCALRSLQSSLSRF